MRKKLIYIILGWLSIWFDSFNLLSGIFPGSFIVNNCRWELVSDYCHDGKCLHHHQQLMVGTTSLVVWGELEMGDVAGGNRVHQCCNWCCSLSQQLDLLSDA